MDHRIEHEIEHGKFLAKNGAGEIWNWESPAGKIRWARRVKMLTEFIKADSSLLELGCGTGYFTKEIVKTKAKIVAIDISPELLTQAKENVNNPDMMNPQIALQKNIPYLKRKAGDSPDETAFFRWKLFGLLKKQGFKTIEIKPFDFLHPAVPPTLIPTISLIGHFFEKVPIFNEIAGSIFIKAYK